MINKINLKTDIEMYKPTEEKKSSEKFTDFIERERELLRKNESEFMEYKKEDFEKEIHVDKDGAIKKDKVMPEISEEVEGVDLKDDEILKIFNVLENLLNMINPLKDSALKLNEVSLEIKDTNLELGLVNESLTKLIHSLEGLTSIKIEDLKAMLKEENGFKELLEKLKPIREENGKEILKAFKNLEQAITEEFKNTVGKDEVKILEKLLGANNEFKKSLDGLIKIDKEFKDKGILLKDVIGNLENILIKTDDKEGNENFNENLNKKPFDFLVENKKEEKVVVEKEVEALGKLVQVDEEKEEKVLGKILEVDDEKISSTSFNKRLEALNKEEKINDGPILRKSNINTDLVRSIKFINRESLKELTVKVYPRDLGEIVISVLKEDEVMKATVKANLKETYNLISQNVSEIKKLLEENGLKVSDLDIALNEDTTFFNGRDSEEKRKEEFKEGKNIFFEEDEVEIEEKNNDIVNILA
ncbi:MAG: flagellar hook-length control protein FliK [Clostridium sp.]|uniref:flagellar hook-length control protein FliK n=1 Tax=Clostridium sp. TaxID=1506 RepID=UPI003F2C16A2